MTVLVVDHGHSTRCGIRDLGVRIAERLGAVHVDCHGLSDYVNACYTHTPDAIVANYRADLMPWWQPKHANELAVLHQYGPDTVDQRAAELLARGFDHVLVLDPTAHPTDPRVHAVGRPLPPAPTGTMPYRAKPDPALPSRTPSREGYRIGSFGFAFPHKQFQLVAAEVATIPGATFALHMSEAYFNGANGAPLYIEGILADVRANLDGHDLEHTGDELSPQELVDWLAGNDANVLLYAPGQPEAGLSSALDYLIAAGRPIMVSSAEMFAAAQGRAAVWPHTKLADVLADLDYWEAQATDLWHMTASRFAGGVNRVLASL